MVTTYLYLIHNVKQTLQIEYLRYRENARSQKAKHRPTKMNVSSVHAEIQDTRYKKLYLTSVCIQKH